ncbi:MAG: hypothetical protein IBX45_11840 [Campylobacterales bacterium]|nr:hypothetical protein [Campylobacterales bacterium]
MEAKSKKQIMSQERELQEQKTSEFEDVSEEQIQKTLEKFTKMATKGAEPDAVSLLKEACMDERAKQESMEQTQTLGNAEAKNTPKQEEEKQQEAMNQESLAYEQARGGR